MADTHTLLLRGVSVQEVQWAIAGLGELAVDVAVHDDADYLDDLGMPLSQYSIEVSLVGAPAEEVRTGRLIQQALPGADSLLIENMQRIV